MAAEACQIRPANRSEASLLTDLALRSKAHWEYDAAFLEDSRADLTLTAEYIDTHPVFVIEVSGRAIGFYSFEAQPDNDVELMHLFVEPSAIGGGYGKQLWLHAVETARRHEWREMVIHSDPFAEEFYRAMGARRVGEVRSPVREGRVLPLLKFAL